MVEVEPRVDGTRIDFRERRYQLPEGRDPATEYVCPVCAGTEANVFTSHDDRFDGRLYECGSFLCADGIARMTQACYVRAQLRSRPE